MPKRPGRPPKPTTIDGDLLEAVRRALQRLAKERAVPTARYPVTSDPHRAITQPQALDLAVLAVQAEAALEILAAELVAKARQHDDATWEHIGDAFGTSAQSAHVRFRA